ncbi:MAG: polysaccharide biosynthesis C-terminal domain-containing protein [candidate division KSB1 bacterium]|nr:polysaccharide biosynthesis C-terminal domain-containing protein [candidate division KSB1 bacterium]
MILHEPLFVFICGTDFIPGKDAFQILAFAVVFQMLNIFFVPLYIALDQQKKIVQFQGVGLLVNVSLNLILIPVLSFIGASYATVATEFCIFALIFIWIRRKLSVPLLPRLKYLLKLAAGTLIMCIFIIISQFYSLHIAIIVVVSVIIYSIALELLNAVNFTHLIRNIVSLHK